MEMISDILWSYYYTFKPKLEKLKKKIHSENASYISGNGTF